MRFCKGRRKQYHLSPLKQDSECSERGLDPLYPTCWSRIFRPGHVIRDVVLGLLVLLGIAILVTVIFVLCFYVIPDEKEAFGKDLSGEAAGIFGREEYFGGNEVEVVEVAGAGDSGLSRYSEADTALKEEVREVLEEVVKEVLEDEEEMRKEAVDPFAEENLLQTPPAEGREIIEDFLSDVAEEVKPLIDEGAVWEEPIAVSPSCGVHQLPTCGEVAWWPNAMLPNHLNHTTTAMVQASTILYDMQHCSPLGPLYACALLEPPCGNSAPLPPCKPLCEEVARQCQHSAPDAAVFDCRAFPDSSDPNICVGMPETGTLESTSRGIILPIQTIPEIISQNVKTENEDIINITNKPIEELKILSLAERLALLRNGDIDIVSTTINQNDQVLKKMNIRNKITTLLPSSRTLSETHVRNQSTKTPLDRLRSGNENSSKSDIKIDTRDPNQHLKRPTTVKTTVEEASCPELQCSDGSCLAISQINNGVIDCSDGTDEQDFTGLLS